MITLDAKDKVYFQSTSILSDGYGLMPKKVARDKLLSLEAKAIYAYLASFAGTNGICFPGKELMLAELGTTERRFNKNIKQLKEYGYIKVHKRRKGNRNDSNLYELLMDTRDIDIAKKEFDTSQFDSGQNDSGQFDSGQIDPPNNNSINSNSINNNSSEDFSSSKVQIEDVIAYYKREVVNRHILSSIEQQSILKLLEDIQGDMVIKAMEISIRRNVRSLDYIEGIIKKWLDSNITTLEELEAHRLQYETKNKSNKSISKSSKNIQSKNVFTEDTFKKGDGNGKFEESSTSSFGQDIKYTDPELRQLLEDIGEL